MNTQQIELKITTSQIKDFLQKFIMAGVFLIVLFPILGDYGNLLYPIGREIFFRIIVEVILVTYIFLIILDPVRSKAPEATAPPVAGTSNGVDRRYLPKFSKILFFLILFWIISGLATLFSVQPKFSFWGNFYRGGGFFTLTHFLVFFLILISLFKTWEQWKKLIYTAIFISFPIAFFTIIQYFLGTDSPQSTLNNPNFLGAYLLLIFFFTLLFAHFEKEKLKKFLILTASLQVVAIMLTNSQGAWFGFLTGCLILIIVYWRKEPEKIKRIAYFSILVISLLIILFSFTRVGKEFLTQAPLISQITNNIEAIKTGGRLESWRAGILGIKERFFFGFGPENFNIPYDKYYQAGQEGSELQNTFFDKAHNFIIEIGTTTGILGLFAYLGIWAMVFRLPLRRNADLTLIRSSFVNSGLAGRQQGLSVKNEEVKPSPLIDADNFQIINGLKFILLATFGAYLAQNLFNIDTIVSNIYVFFWLAFTQFLTTKSAAISYNQWESVKTTKNRLMLWLLAIILIPLLLFSLKQYHFDFLKANYYNNLAERYFQAKNYKMAFETYEKGIKEWSYLSHDLYHKYASFLMQWATEIKKSQPELAAETTKKALTLIDKAIENQPHFNRSWILGGVISTFSIELGEPGTKEKADYYFTKAIQMSPGRPFTWIAWGKSDLLVGNYKEARKKFEKARDLWSEGAEPYYMLAITNIYEEGKEDTKLHFAEARKKRVENNFSGFDPTSEEALLLKAKAYSSVKDFENLEKIYQWLTQRKPQNIQYWVSLAVTQKEMGHPQEAKQTIEELLLIYPQLKNDGNIQKFIQELRSPAD